MKLKNLTDIYTSKQVHTQEKCTHIYTNMFVMCIRWQCVSMCVCVSVKTSSVTHFQFDKHDFVFLIYCIHTLHIHHTGECVDSNRAAHHHQQNGNNSII